MHGLILLFEYYQHMSKVMKERLHNKESNALSHVRDKHVLKWLKKLMLGDFEVVEFEEKWKEMVATFELEDNTWIAELVVVADYSSIYGNEVLQTTLRSLERSGDELFTKEMFKIFQSYLCRTIKLRVVDCKEMVTFSVYTVVKYCSGSVWRVSYCPSTVDFTCTCMRMQSIGLPCDHILAMLVSLNFMKLPSSLVLNKWSKVATKQMKDKYPNSTTYWDSQLMAMYATLVEVSRKVCVAAYRDEEEYDKMLHFLSNEARRLKSKQNSEHCADDNQLQQQDGDDFDVKDADRSEWMNVADKEESKSVANVVELATSSVLAPTVLEMEMVVFHPPNKVTVMMTISFFLMFDRMQQSQTQTFVGGSSRVGP
ncbi:Protein FAR1-RELATED SEQUENCE 9 [Glycine soja]